MDKQTKNSDIKFNIWTKPFLTGLITIIPILLTGYIAYWIFITLEKIVKVPLLWLLPKEWYAPGIGIFIAVLLIYFIGLLMQGWVFKKVFYWLDNTFMQIPIVKHLYGIMKDFFAYFSPSHPNQYSGVVKVQLPGHEISVIGLKTREQTQLPQELQAHAEELVLVYFPISYMIGGYTLLVPKDWTTPIDWSIKKASSFILSGGMALKDPGAE